MDKYIEQAVTNHNKGYNCAQSVACAFVNEVTMEEKTLFKVAEALGRGMGNMEGTCGAISCRGAAQHRQFRRA